MRSRILLFLFIFSCQLATAQSQRFRAGLIGGAVASDIDGFAALGHRGGDFYKAGVTFGGMVNAKLSDKNSFQFEMVYIQKGSYTGKPDSANNYTYYQIKLDYIEVPIIFRRQMHIQINNRSTDRFAFEFGPTFGALINIKQNGLFYQDGLYVSGLFKDDDFKRTDIGLTAGISYNFLDRFYFNVRYQNSLLPVTKHQDVFNQFIIYTFNKGHNMVFNFTVRYLFGKQESVE